MYRRLLNVIGFLAISACSTEPSDPELDPEGPSFAISSTGAQIITEAEIARQAENTFPTKSWVLYSKNAGTGAFQVGPSTAPEGVGSLGLATPASSDKVWLFNFDYFGEPLNALTSLRYSTFRTTGSGQQVPSLNIQIDFNGNAPGGFATLVFEPVYNTSQGTVQDGVWQAWDAFNNGNAIWWSTTVMPACEMASNCFISWNAILSANPDAVVIGGIGINQGSGNPGLTAAVDQFVVRFGADAPTTFDFEPWVTPTTRDTCKNSGWQTARRADGTEFKNQGDCVSYVNTGN